MAVTSTFNLDIYGSRKINRKLTFFSIFGKSFPGIIISP